MGSLLALLRLQVGAPSIVHSEFSNFVIRHGLLTFPLYHRTPLGRP